MVEVFIKLIIKKNSIRTHVLLRSKRYLDSELFISKLLSHLFMYIRSKKLTSNFDTYYSAIGKNSIKNHEFYVGQGKRSIKKTLYPSENEGEKINYILSKQKNRFEINFCAFIQPRKRVLGTRGYFETL